jgi:molybdenum cofactor cytidylyltransferase
LGASAISDRRDVIPAAIEQAGGRITLFGMPVDPGNLLLLGELDGTRVVGLPGCARSPKRNGFDFVLWRLLAGLTVGRPDIAAMGVGGLLSEIPSRPQPREPRLPRIAALVLAAGRSTRMGRNKLLAPVGGLPMVRHAVLAALASADPVIVVTGNEEEKIRASLQDLPVIFCNNPDYSDGLSASLRSGVNNLPGDCDGVLILLGDMPGVDAQLLDRLVAAFAPEENRAIVVPTRHGQRGNPVLWGRSFFPALAALSGDSGGRLLFARHADQLCEVEAEDDSPLTDIDTSEALAAFELR